MALYDTIDLKDQIKVAQKLYDEACKENVSLQATLREVADQAARDRRQKNITEHEEVLAMYQTTDERYRDDVISINEEIFEGNAKYIEQNVKLELSILNEEIKSSLPKLQKQVLEQERFASRVDSIVETQLTAVKKVDFYHSHLDNQETNPVTHTDEENERYISYLLTLSYKDMEELTSSYQTKTVALRERKVVSEDSQKEQIDGIKVQINVLRREISELVQSKNSCQRSLNSYRSSCIQEEGRVQYLLDEIEKYKQLINDYHSD